MFINFLEDKLTLGDLLAYHNEHRVLFFRLLVILLGYLSNLNMKWLMYASAFCQLTILLTLFKYYSNKFGYSHKSLYVFVPIPFLIFTLQQHTNTLWGFQLGYHFCLCLSILSLYFLSKVNPENSLVTFFICLLITSVASFTHLHGLFIWVIGFMYFLYMHFHIPTSKNYWLKRLLLWSMLATIIFILYFWDFSTPVHHPSILFVFTNPIKALRFFIAMFGNLTTVTSVGKLWVASSGILVIFSIAYTLLKIYKNKISYHNIFPIFLIIYTLIFIIAVTASRSGFGIGAALFSRYTTFTLLSIIGTYLLLVHSIYHTHNNSKSLKIVFFFLLLFITKHIISAYPEGLRSGAITKNLRLEGQKILLNYKTANKTAVQYHLYINEILVKQYASKCAEHKLSVFAEN